MTVRIGIVNYGVGNIRSLLNAFLAIGADARVADTPRELDEVSHLVLPGVGAFPKGIERLRACGFEEPIHRLAGDGRPLLGVCLGMQFLVDAGEEHVETRGLGFVPGRAKRLDAPGLRLPHVGWNETVAARDSRLLGKAGATGVFYYVHGYGVVPDDAGDTAMTCSYGAPFAAGIERGHVFGVQFHPEKSHADGLAVLRRFTEVAAC